MWPQGHIPIRRAVSMGRCNTCSKSSCKSLGKLISFVSADSNGTLPCLGSDGELLYRSFLDGKYCQSN